MADEAPAEAPAAEPAPEAAPAEAAPAEAAPAEAAPAEPAPAALPVKLKSWVKSCDMPDALKAVSSAREREMMMMIM